MDQRSVVNRPSTFNIPLGPPQVPYAQQAPPQLPSQQQQHHPPRPPPPSIASILQSPTRQYYPPLEDPQETQSRMEARLKRSVTLVYWWKAGADPLRMHQELSTFPLFALSEFKQLVADLGLGPNTYVDAYNPNAGTWEQQNISAVRIVDSEQRLLYRTRISLLEGLRDSECPGLESEIRMQPPPRGRPPPPQSSTSATQVQQSPAVRPTKRLAPDTPTSPNKQLRSFYQHGTPTFPQSGLPGPSAPPYAPPAQTPSVAPSQLFSSPAVRSGPLSPFIHRDTPLAPAPTPTQQPYASTSNSAPHPESNATTSSSTQNSTPDSPQIPTHPHPPLKRWPNDYAVCEIAAGFSQMDGLVRTTPSLTQKAAFERVFGCRYVKSTVCRHRGVWKRADKGLKERFERMGPVEGALWGEFVKKTDFRREGTHSHTSSQGSNGRIKEQSGDGSNGGPMPGMEYHLPALGLGLSGHTILGGDAQPPMASLAPPGPPG